MILSDLLDALADDSHLTDAEVEAELREMGIDPAASYQRLRERLAEHGHSLGAYDADEALSRLHDDHGAPCLCGEDVIDGCPSPGGEDCAGTPDDNSDDVRWMVDFGPGTDADDAFRPDWRSPPGDTIRDLMVERGVDVVALARALGFSVGGVEDLLRGDLPIRPRTASILARTLGGTAPFWVRRDEQYRLPVESDCAGLDAAEVTE